MLDSKKLYCNTLCGRREVLCKDMVHRKQVFDDNRDSLKSQEIEYVFMF